MQASIGELKTAVLVFLRSLVNWHRMYFGQATADGRNGTGDGIPTRKAVDCACPFKAVRSAC